MDMTKKKNSHLVHFTFSVGEEEFIVSYTWNAYSTRWWWYHVARVG